jgi:hypothetical protein
MADTSVLAIYDDFSGGHYDPGTPGFGMPVGTWTGTNVVKYASGMLGTRRGVSPITSSNNPGGAPIMCARGGNNDLYFATDAEAFHRLTSSVTSSASGLFGGSDQVGGLFVDNRMYFATSGTSGLMNYNGTTMNVVSANVRGTCLAVFNDRLYVSGDLTGTGYRVYYSQPADYDNFPAGNFFDIPPAFGRVQCLEVLNGQLVIGIQNSISEVPRWYILTANPRNGGSLQEIGNGPYPYDFRAIAKIQEGILVAAADGVFIYRGGRQFDRIDNIFLEHPLGSQAAGGGQIAVSEDGYSALIGAIGASGLDWLYYYNGHTRTWARHTLTHNFDAGLGKLMCPNGPSTFALFKDGGFAGAGPYYAGVTFDTTDGVLPFIGTNYSTDDIDGVETAIQGSFYLPPVMAPDGATFDVRSVDIEYYPLSGSATASCTMQFFNTDYNNGASSTGSGTFTVGFGGNRSTVTIGSSTTKCRMFQPRIFIQHMGIKRVVVRGTLNRDRDAR